MCLSFFKIPAAQRKIEHANFHFLEKKPVMLDDDHLCSFFFSRRVVIQVQFRDKMIVKGERDFYKESI